MTSLDPSAPTRLEQDITAVLLWLRHNAGREITYRDIASGVGIPKGRRLQTAVRHARAAAEGLGCRLEKFKPSQDPLVRRARTPVTRFNLQGRGDEFGVQDALFASRLAITAMEDMRRSCVYEGTNVNNPQRRSYADMATAVDGCIMTVSGVTNLNTEVMRLRGEAARLAQQVVDLQAQLGDVAGDDPYVTAI